MGENEILTLSPYDNFVYTLKAETTKRQYPNRLDRFLSFIGLRGSIQEKCNKLYELGHNKELFVTKRKTAWYGDSNYVYNYSNTEKKALPWTSELAKLKQVVEILLNIKFNSCLMNLYHDGNEGMGWHSDDEKSIEEDSTIASVSFGAERKFSFKHKQSKKIISILLEHGSLLLMKEGTQKNWLHSLPKSTKITLPRINLTFRRWSHKFQL
jgi:alkylated DNA repair dioxygenase AlkB